MKEKRLTTIEWWLLAVRQVDFWILGATTAIMAWGMALSYFQEQTIPQRLIFQFAIVTTFLVWVAVDGALSKLLPFFSDEVTAKGFSQSDSDKKKLVAFIGVISFALLICTGTMSLWSSGEIADNMTKATDLSDIEATSKQTSDNYNLSLSSIEKELSQARATESDRLAAAKRQGRQIVATAWKDGGDDYRLIYQNRRSWLNSMKDNSRKYRTLVTWRNNLRQAKSDSAALVAKETAVVAQLLNDKRQILSGQKLRDSTMVMLSGIGLQRISRDNAKFDRRRNTIIFVEIFCAAFLVPLCLLIGYWRRVYGQRIDDENYGIFYLLSQAWAKLWGLISERANTGLSNVKFATATATAGVATMMPSPTLPPQPATATKTPVSLVGQGSQPTTKATATKNTKTIITDLKGLKDNCRAHYKRSFTSATEEARQSNKEKYLSEKDDLEALGFEVIPDPASMKLSIKST